MAYITGCVDQEWLLRNTYLVTENRILYNQIEGCTRLTEAEHGYWAELGYQFGQQVLAVVATIVNPETGSR